MCTLKGEFNAALGLTLNLSIDVGVLGLYGAKLYGH